MEYPIYRKDQNGAKFHRIGPSMVASVFITKYSSAYSVSSNPMMIEGAQDNLTMESSKEEWDYALERFMAKAENSDT